MKLFLFAINNSKIKQSVVSAFVVSLLILAGGINAYGQDFMAFDANAMDTGSNSVVNFDTTDINVNTVDVNTAGLQAAGLRTVDSALSFSHQAIMDVSRARHSEAWQKLSIHSAIPKTTMDNFIRGYDSNFVRTIVSLGPSKGVELINQAMSGKSMLRVTYLIRYELTAVTWFMYFYNTGENWVLSELNYDISVSAAFKDINPDGQWDAMSLKLGQWQHQQETRINGFESAMNEFKQDLVFTNVNLNDLELGLLSEVDHRLSDVERRFKEMDMQLLGMEMEDVTQKSLAKPNHVEALEKEVMKLRGIVEALMPNHGQLQEEQELPAAQYSETLTDLDLQVAPDVDVQPELNVQPELDLQPELEQDPQAQQLDGGEILELD